MGISFKGPHNTSYACGTAPNRHSRQDEAPEYALSDRDYLLCLYVLMFGAQGAVRSRGEVEWGPEIEIPIDHSIRVAIFKPNNAD
jgi:hypothetical protein